MVDAHDLRERSTPSSAAAPLHQRIVARVRAPGIGPWHFLPIALTAGAVAFLLPTALGVGCYAMLAQRDGYAALLIVLGVAAGVFAGLPATIAGALCAHAMRWRSRRAMWVAGLAAGAATLPALLTVVGFAFAL